MKKEVLNQVKQCLLQDQISDFIYCKGWLFPYVALSTTNIHSFLFDIIAYILFFSLISQSSITWLKDLRRHDMV